MQIQFEMPTMQSRKISIWSQGFAALVPIAVLVLAQPAHADDESRQFTFSWPFKPSDSMKPRGGTSKGAHVDLATNPSQAWQALHEPGLDKFERDRRAILAMAGGYRTSFDFIETVGFTAGFEPARPYQSWGTEYIYVIADEGDAISLQHIMVMFVEDAEGVVHGPIVQKHWRQEWKYEDRSLHVYMGNGRWQERRISASEAEGKWSQAVFQVDDSPRYAAIGEWAHDRNYSSWTSEETWRPLPRRESSVRDDYQVLIGTNRHTIVPTGWVQEEENLKVALDSDGKIREHEGYLSRELGVNRYEHIENFDFSAGDDYWQLTGAFWADVRRGWERIFSDEREFVFDETRDGRALWQDMFEYATGLEEGDDYDAKASRAFVEETIARYVE
jgi:hypothetical protein